MTKKMKVFGLDGSSSALYGDDAASKTIIKHHTLLQEYHELDKDVQVSRNKLENIKRRKLTLQAEVRFLRRRYKFLLERQSPDIAQGRGNESVQYGLNQRRSSMKVPMASNMETTRGNLPQLFRANQKGRINRGQETSVNSVPSFVPKLQDKEHAGKNVVVANRTMISKSKSKGRSIKGKEVMYQTSIPIIDLNQQERMHDGSYAAMQSSASIFDLRNRETAFKHQLMLHQPPVFDLNQISREEEELQNNYDPVRFEELKKGLINEDLGDMKISACRNVEDSSNRAAKRKISWQDPVVALRV